MFVIREINSNKEKKMYVINQLFYMLCMGIKNGFKHQNQITNQQQGAPQNTKKQKQKMKQKSFFFFFFW